MCFVDSVIEAGQEHFNEVYKLLSLKSIDSLTWDIVKMSQHTIGTPGGVEFDWEFVMKQEEELGNIVGFFHTHPFCPADSSEVGYSSTDFNTMSAWVDCFGKALYCIIGRGQYDPNPTVHVFAPKKRIVLCEGSVFGGCKAISSAWEAEDSYYKGKLNPNKINFLTDSVLRLPSLYIIK